MNRIKLNRLACCCSIALCLAGSGAVSLAQEAQKPSAATVTAKAGPISSDVSLSGVFVAKNVVELSVSPKTTQAFKVVTAAPHGTLVRSGDVVVEFDTRSFTDQMIDQEQAVENAKLAMEEAVRDFELLKIQNPLDLEQAELTWKQAVEDFEFFKEWEFPFAAKENEQSMKNAQNFLDYTHEELKQLEKMYKADDLTEETEEIVLRRTRDDFERQKFGFERTKKMNEREREVGLARRETQRQIAHRLAEIAHEKSRLTLPMAIEKAAQGIQKVKRDLEKAERTLGDLRQDAELFTVRAPIDGFVYYGKTTSGKWDSVAEMKNKLRARGAVNANEIFITIVDNSALSLLANAPEAEVGKLRVGMPSRITPSAFKDMQLTGQLAQIASLPNSDGSFETIIEVGGDEDNRLVAGMNGSAKIRTYENANAVLVPAKSVFADETDDTKRYVYFQQANGKHSRVDVHVGVTSGDMVEILSGVKAGDVLLADKPAN